MLPLYQNIASKLGWLGSIWIIQLFVCLQFSPIVIDGQDKVNVFLLRHVESVYNQAAQNMGKKLANSKLNFAFHDSSTHIDSPVSEKGAQQLNAINQFFGMSILNQQTLLDILSGAPIEFESSPLRRAQFTAFLARNSLYNTIQKMTDNKQKALTILENIIKKKKKPPTATEKENIENKKKQIMQLKQVFANLESDKFKIIRDLQEEKDLIHTDSISECDKAWFTTPGTIDDLYKAYLRKGLPVSKPTSGGQLKEEMYLGHGIKFKYIEHIGRMKKTEPSTDEELIGYAQHLKDSFKKGIKVFIGGAHSKWIIHFINKYKSGTDAGLKEYAKHKVPNGAALHLVIEIPQDISKDIKIISAKLYDNHGIKIKSAAVQANYDDDLLEEYYDLLDLYNDLNYDLYDDYNLFIDYMDDIKQSGVEKLMDEIMALEALKERRLYN